LYLSSASGKMQLALVNAKVTNGGRENEKSL
jgi:hypothetical protein